MTETQEALAPAGARRAEARRQRLVISRRVTGLAIAVRSGKRMRDDNMTMIASSLAHATSSRSGRRCSPW
jgi:hypothetical protein